MLFSFTKPSTKEITLLNPADTPADTVSSIVWAPSPQTRMFTCADWDSKIRIYDLSLSDKAILQKACFTLEEPCLCTAWSGDMSKLYAGSIDGSVKELDITTGKPQNIGYHDAGVRDIYWVPSLNVLCTLSFDKMIKFWDPRQQKLVISYEMESKVYCSDMSVSYLAVGLSTQKISLFKLRDLQQGLLVNGSTHESPTGQEAQLRAVSWFPNEKGLGIGTNDGRANISLIRENFNGALQLEGILTFKAQNMDGSKTLYPVHGIEFNSRAENFMCTAGGDGMMCFWDSKKKSKIKKFDFKKIPVTKIKMSPDGEFVAYALGYDWARGVEGSHSMRSKICVHKITDDELKVGKGK